MSKCKCGGRQRIVSNLVQSMDQFCSKGTDLCSNPCLGEPDMLSTFVPLIYDEIGVNLCATFEADPDLTTTYPTATSASVQVLGATYTYGDGNVQIEQITGRTNCYQVTLSNLAIQFAVRLYDSACRLLGTVFPTATYLPADTTAPTYDEDTNPTQVEFQIFSPYGVAYDTTTTPAAPTPVVNWIGFTQDNSTLTQGLNLYALGKVLDLDGNNITVGLTLVLQSLYYAGYKVRHQGRIDVPKGSIINPENSECMRFVAGDLLDLEIKPLNLDIPCQKEEIPTGEGQGVGCVDQLGCLTDNQTGCSTNVGENFRMNLP